MPPLFAQFGRFCAAGVLVTGVHFAILVVLVEVGELWPTAASGLAFCAAVVVSFALNARFVFGVVDSPLVRGGRFALVAFAGLGLNTTVMYGLSDRWGLHYLASQTGATGVVLFWNFGTNRAWTFKRRARGTVEP